MNIRLPVVFLLSVLVSHWVIASDEITHHESQIIKALLKIEKLEKKRKWSRMIKKSKEALPSCLDFYGEFELVCINLLIKINNGYRRKGLFNPDSNQIQKAYENSKKSRGETHPITVTTREHLYANLLYQERYLEAIPMAEAMLEYSNVMRGSEYKNLELQRQIYALYGITEQWHKEEITLRLLLITTEQLIGKESEDYSEVQIALSKNLCTQKKYHEYFNLVRDGNLKSHCNLR